MECMVQADPRKVSTRAKKRGLPQLGTLGAGNHYAEIQVPSPLTPKPNALNLVDLKPEALGV